MGISDVLFEFEIALSDELPAGFYGDDEDPIRLAIEGLLGHMRAVRMLPGLDQPPCEKLHRVRYAKATPLDDDDEWIQPTNENFDQERDDCDQIHDQSDHIDQGDQGDRNDRGDDRGDDRGGDVAELRALDPLQTPNPEDRNDE